jgi:hypothetical protein
MIPRDSSHYEDVIAVSFPEVGRWRVQVFLTMDDCDVNNVSQAIVSPLVDVPAGEAFRASGIV